MEPGTTVCIHYKGTLDDGSVFDSSEGHDPLEFEVGTQSVIRGFEEAVMGMGEGETKTVKIPCVEAYGEVNSELVAGVPRENLPDAIKPELGMLLQVKTPDGEVPVRVVEITDEEIILDGNHPLAGQDLTFELTLVSTRI